MARTYHTFDVIIIGAGTAGLSALKEAKKYTDNILLIHEGDAGTTCARVGCMPSKALIEASNLYDSHKKMPDNGIKGSQHLQPSIPEMLKAVRDKRDYFVSHMKDETNKYQEHIVVGTARYESPTTIRANGKLYHCKASIIATGSTPFIPQKYREFEDDIMTTDTLFERKDLPKRMAVIGMGAVGLEIAQALAQVGIDITAINRNGKVGLVNDPSINAKIRESLAEDMKLWFNSNPDIRRTENGLVLYSDSQEAIVDAIFIAAGRKPNLARLGLKRLGVDMNGQGVPPFNRYTMQIPDQPIYIAGDATDERAILHEASDEGRRAACHALNGNAGQLPRYPQLQIVFTNPVTAMIGDTEYACRHDDIIYGDVDFAKQGRAALMDEAFGKLRIFADKDGGYVRGAEIMAPAAEHMSHFIAQALTQRMTIKEMLNTPFYHPTLEEGLKTALKNAHKKINYS